MSPRFAHSAIAALVLLGSTTVTSLALHLDQAYASHSAATRSDSLTVTRSYFNALARMGQPGHGYQALERLYAPGVVLIESMSTGRPLIHNGLQKAHAFHPWSELSWTVLRSEQLSPAVVLTVERPYTRGPGHELNGATPWITLFSVKNGRIVRLVWLAR